MAFIKVLAIMAALAWSGAAQAQTAQRDTLLATVKSRGFLICGVTAGLAGFAIPDAQGRWTGLDVDYCRAIAAAIFDDPDKVKFVPLQSKDRFVTLQSGEIDVLICTSTWTMTRDTLFGLNFAGINYFGGEGFMVRKSLGIETALKLEGASVCTEQGTTTEQNVADFFRRNRLRYELVSFATGNETLDAYASGRCDAYASDRAGLAIQRLKLTTPAEHVVLPETISNEPLGPAVRHGDDQWFDLVKWTLNAMLNAEELGVTKANAEAMRASRNPEIMRLLGVEGALGEGLGLDRDWAYRIVRHIGNYGESFERNLGQGSPLQLARGRNALWTKGGLHYPPPLR
jgi:general L-amino acid transport system substrate-binding protein